MHYTEWIPKAVRAMRGDMTLKAFAEKVELSLSYLSDIEQGRTTPTLFTLEQIFTACGASLVLGWESPSEPSDYLYVRRDTLNKLTELVKSMYEIENKAKDA